MHWFMPEIVKLDFILELKNWSVFRLLANLKSFFFGLCSIVVRV